LIRSFLNFDLVAIRHRIFWEGCRRRTIFAKAQCSKEKAMRISKLAHFMVMTSLCLPATTMAQIDPRAATAQQLRNDAALRKRCSSDWQPYCLEQFNIPDPHATPPPPPPPQRPDVSEAQSLIATGPQPLGYSLGTVFSVRGFLRSGWPLVIDYQAPAGSQPVLTIVWQYGSGATLRIPLPNPPDGARQYYKFSLDAPSGDGEVKIASFEIKAQIAAQRDGKSQDVPVRVFGFGAGPRAVGSVAITDIIVPEAGIPRPFGKETVFLNYQYRVENQFDIVAEDLWRTCNKFLCRTFFRPRPPFRLAKPDVIRGSYAINRKTKSGAYELKVRGWLTCAGLVDPTTYNLCGNNLDWVIGSAGPVFVTK
jgi:hypothetical protein